MAIVKYHRPESNFFTAPSLFNEFYNHFDNSKKFEPSINLSENENSYSIEIALPGFKKEDVDVKLEQDKLHISSKNEKQQAAEGDTYFRKEIIKGSFERVFQLPKKADLNTITALHENGVLKIGVTKAKEETYTKTIAIK
jgi:HSP20 family protein